MLKRILFTFFLLYGTIGNLFSRDLCAQDQLVDVSAKLLDSAEIQDYRIKQEKIEILSKFLKNYNSPLKNYAEFFVNEADKNNLDYRLLVAISGVESTFGKTIPFNSYNAWGWNNGDYYFQNWEEAIGVISKTLNEKYAKTWDAKNPYEIGPYYAASPTWATRVDYFMQQIEKYPVNKLSNLEITI